MDASTCNKTIGAYGRSDGGSPLESLAMGIVKQAVEDWREICKPETVEAGIAEGYGYSAISFYELRRFFKSGWCELLCGGANPECVLDRLERERRAAIKAKGAEHDGHRG